MAALVTTSTATQKNTYNSSTKNSLDLEAEEKKGRRQGKVGVYLQKYSVPTAISIIGTVAAIPLVGVGAYYATQGNEDLEPIMDAGFAVGGASAAAAAIYTAASNIKNGSTTVFKYIKENKLSSTLFGMGFFIGGTLITAGCMTPVEPLMDAGFIAFWFFNELGMFTLSRNNWIKLE